MSDFTSLTARPRGLVVRKALALAALAFPAGALAHGFGALYNLPVPLWLYAWAATATLVVSFLIAGLFLSSRQAPVRPATRDLRGAAWVRGLRRMLPALRALSVFLLLLTIATGFFGNRDPLRNFAPTFFWIIFLLAFTYLIALIGDAYAAINPFRSLAVALDRLFRGYARGRFRYPASWGDWPALALYLGFIAFELFGTGRPHSVAVFLAAYTLLNLAGVGLIGMRAWFGHCEFFSVFLRLVALMAPIDYVREDGSGQGRLRLRRPFAGLVQERPAHPSTVVFALAMLSTTAFDGLKATEWWVVLFWDDPTGVLRELVGARPVNAIAAVRPWFLAWESLWLFASPFLYFGAYLAALWLARALTRGRRPVRELALDFGYTLLPIALVYHITHYWTLILSHGLKIFSFISDPFGWRWDLFGTAFKFRAPILPEMGLVWHSQVGLILLGHIVSVWAAHRVALRVWPSRGQAMLSQLPMLGLMIAFTIAGLWILAQPLTESLMR